MRRFSRSVGKVAAFLESGTPIEVAFYTEPRLSVAEMRASVERIFPALAGKIALYDEDAEEFVGDLDRVLQVNFRALSGDFHAEIYVSSQRRSQLSRQEFVALFAEVSGAKCLLESPESPFIYIQIMPDGTSDRVELDEELFDEGHIKLAPR